MLDFFSSASSQDKRATRSTTASGRMGIYAVLGKRVFDLFFAVILLPAVLPLILVLWCLVRLDGGPGFFGHVRVGQGGKLFKCWKIRSMVVNAETRLQDYLKVNPDAAAEWERDHKLTDDPRINRFGRILRKTSLDELPQIWNVLRGEMSFVGPRPVVATELIKYGSSASVYLAQKPGITGLWQVSGRNEISYGQRVAMDVSYLSRRGFLTDLRIIFQTFFLLFWGTGR